MKTAKAWHQLDVEEMDNFTFRVTSEEKAGTYLVDCFANNGKGACNCPDFEIRIAPIYHNKKAPPIDKQHWISACKHQLRVKLYIADRLIAEMMKQKGYRYYDAP